MARTDEVITLGVEIEIDDAVRHMATFERQMKRKMDNITKAVGNLGHKNARVLEKTIELSEDWMTETDKLILSQKKEYQELVKLGSQIEDLEKSVEDLEGAQKANAEANLNRLKKQGKAQAQALAKSLGKQGAFVKLTTEVTESITKGIEAASPALSSFFGKDLKGTLEGTMSFAGKALSKSLDVAARSRAVKGIMGAGGGLAGAGEKLMGRGAAKGGIGGGAMAGAGKGLKAIGGMMSKLGPMLQMIGKLGPLISTLSTVILSVVKLFIDAEAQAKAFNKEILASASSAEFLAGSGEDANLAFGALEDTMKQVRDSAYDYSNLDWGISVEEHKQVVNVLTQEGVALGHMAKEANAAGQSVGKFTAELAHVSVAYSRAFGVPLQEINQMQAEMMTSMGMNLEETSLAFEHMKRSATDSGIAANKFFGMIRGVSQDLSLYNVRMEQAVKLLKMLGKVMDPRNAQKFMQGVIGTMKNMSQDDRLKVALLAGGKGRKIVQKDLKNRRDNLYKDVAGALGKADEAGVARVKTALEKGGSAADAIWKDVEKTAPGKLGALRESGIELNIDTAAAKKGVYGQAFAMENMGAGAQLDMLTAALAGWGGGKTLMEGAGSIGMTKMAENMGIGTEQLRGMMKLEVAVEEQKKTLLEQAKSEEEKKKIRDMTSQDILDTMSKEEQKALKEGTKSTRDFAKEQGQLTTSLLDKLSVLVDFVMNQLYNVFLDIWDLLGSLTGKFGVGPSQEERALKRKAFATGDKDLQTAIKNATDVATGRLDVSKVKGSLIGGVEGGGKGAGDLITEAFKHYTEAAATGGEEERKGTNDILTNMLGTLEVGMRGGGGPEKLAENVAKAMKMANIDEERAGKVQAAVASGKGVSEAMKGVLNTDEMMDVWRKSVWAMDADSLATIMPNLQAGGGMIGKARAQGATMDYLQAYEKFSKGDISAEEAAGQYSGYQDTDEAKEILGKTADATEEGAKASQELAKAGTTPSTLYTKWSNSFLNEYARTMEDTILDAVRAALFEYYLYSEEEDRGKLLDKMHEIGMTPKALAEELSRGTQTVGNVLGYKVEEAEEKQTGGMVTGVTNGMAQVRAAAGEGLTSIGKGEVIVPKGGTIARPGEGTTARVEISVQRGFEQFIRATVVEEIQNFRRRERFG